MTDERQGFIDWAEGRANRMDETNQDATLISLKDLERVLEWLAEPRLPKEPTNTMLIHMDNALQGPVHHDNMRSIYRALYAYLTAPKPKRYRILGHTLGIDDALKMARDSVERGCEVTIKPEGP